MTSVLLLTDEDDFNALASTVLQAGDEGRVQVYRLGPPSQANGVVAPFMGSDILFGDGLSRTALADRYADGGRIFTRPADTHPVPNGADLLFVLRGDGHLEPATRTARPSPRPGETVVLLSRGRAERTPATAPIPSSGR